MKRREFYRQHLGTVRPVLFEQHKNPVLLSGFTDNYIKIELATQAGMVNSIAPVLLENLSADGEVMLTSCELMSGIFSDER